MKYTTLSAGEMRKLHGKRATIETDTEEICTGQMSIDDEGRVYIAHSNRKATGGIPNEMFGYKYGWNLYGGHEEDSTSNNNEYKWIEIHDDVKLPKDFGKMKGEIKQKPTLEVIQLKKVKYSDDDTVYSEDSIELDGKTYTSEQLQEHIKKARRVLARYKKISF